jgi:hypothetical protein
MEEREFEKVKFCCWSLPAAWCDRPQDERTVADKTPTPTKAHIPPKKKGETPPMPKSNNETPYFFIALILSRFHCILLKRPSTLGMLRRQMLPCAACWLREKEVSFPLLLSILNLQIQGLRKLSLISLSSHYALPVCLSPSIGNLPTLFAWEHILYGNLLSLRDADPQIQSILVLFKAQSR